MVGDRLRCPRAAGAVEEAPMGADEVTRRMLATYEAGEMVTMCAWCRRVEIDGDWVLAPRAALTAIDTPYALSHSICPECAGGGSEGPYAAVAEAPQPA
jgi:hypothetical protein